MQQILFIAEIPVSRAMSTAPGYPHEWIQFESATSTILKPLKAYKRLKQNAWLLPVENVWPYLLDMSNLATHSDIPYSILLIDGVTDLSGTIKPPLL